MNVAASLRYLDFNAPSGRPRTFERNNTTKEERRNGAGRQPRPPQPPRDEDNRPPLRPVAFSLPSEPTTRPPLQPQAPFDAASVLSLIETPAEAAPASDTAPPQAESLFMLLAQVLSDD
jgi:hypothetical protein